MMKHLTSGINRLEFQRSGSIVLEKRITSGSMVPDLVDLVPKFTTIVEKNTVVANRIVQLAVTVTGIWRSGTTYLHSLITTVTATIPN